MKKWILKAIVQKAFGLLPGGFKLNYLFQRYVSKAVVLSDEFFETMLAHYQELRDFAGKEGFKMEGAKVFEIGTGWHPIVPICCWLSGAREVLTVDLNSHLRRQNLKVLLDKFLDYNNRGELQSYFVPDQDRIQQLRKVSGLIKDLEVYEVLEHLNIRQIITNAASSGLPSGYFDLCYSVNVYEHIDENALQGITAELARITQKGGTGYHAIGVYDHFSHIDKSISKFNYLRFSKSQWTLIDNKIQPQNRLRISYFRELFIRNGFYVQHEIFKDAEPGEIERIPLHKDFAGVDDLAVPYGTFILKKGTIPSEP